MIRPLDTPDPATWLADPDWRWGDMRVCALLPSIFPVYVRIENCVGDPLVGTLDGEVLAALLPPLSAGTATPESCFFALWTGYGPQPVDATIELRRNAYALYQGAVADAMATAELALGQTPNICWPADRAWCLVTDIDLPASVVGCDATLAVALAAVPDLQTARLSPDANLVEPDRLDQP